MRIKLISFFLIYTLLIGVIPPSISSENYSKDKTETDIYNSIYKTEIKKDETPLIDCSKISYYSSVDEGYVSSVKNQGNFSTCWAHSITACAETYMIKNHNYSTDIDFSELHLAYYQYNNAYDKLNLLDGDASLLKENNSDINFLTIGSESMAPCLTLARWCGFVEENTSKKFASSNTTLKFTDTDSKNAYSQDFVHLQNAYWIDPANISEMKSFIYKYGAAQASYYDASLDGIMGVYYNSKNKAYCYIGNNEKISTNHSITIVGWDDDFSKSNFNYKYRPKKDGAWLVKNTWGSYWGNNGYFWISYEDQSLISNYASFYELEDSTNYDNNYQYDGSSSFDILNFSKKVNMANVFVPDSNEELKAVSFFTVQENVEYDIRIYINLKDKNDPTSGTLVSSSIIEDFEKYPGYHTINFKKPITVKKNSPYSIIISQFATDSKSTSVLIDRTRSTKYFNYINSTESGQSFLLQSYSNEWEDVSDPNKKAYNFRIKAFTDETVSQIQQNLKKIYFYDIYGFDEVFAVPFNSINSSDENDDIVQMEFCGYDQNNIPVYCCTVDDIHNNSIYFMDNNNKFTTVVSNLNAYNVFKTIISSDETYTLLSERIEFDESTLSNDINYNDYSFDQNILISAALPIHNDGTSWDNIYLYYGNYGDSFEEVKKIKMSESNTLIKVNNIYYSGLLAQGNYPIYSVILSPDIQEEISNAYFLGFCEDYSDRKTFFSPEYNILYAHNDKYKFYKTKKSLLEDINEKVFVFNDANISALSEEYYCGYWAKQKINYADVNNDDIISMVDVTECQKYLAGYDNFNDYQIYLADINKDMILDMHDIVQIQKKIANLIDKFN